MTIDTAKRFYQHAAAVEVPGGWGVALDGKVVKTPARAALVLPNRALAVLFAVLYRIDNSRENHSFNSGATPPASVRLTAGTYLSAPVVLKSNITFELEKGATLLGSPDHADYPEKTEFHEPDVQPLVSATDAENLTITGEGTTSLAGLSSGA